MYMYMYLGLLNNLVHTCTYTRTHVHVYVLMESDTLSIYKYTCISIHVLLESTCT